jgi:hypothetical protein
MAARRYKQLKLHIDSHRDEYNSVWLQFKLGRHGVEGVLNGDCSDWYFESSSHAFLKMVPHGVLHKYALWIDVVPKNISTLYNCIYEAAYKAGYEMTEKEYA